MNLYAYVANRPMMFRDPSGRLSESLSNLSDGYYDLGGAIFSGNNLLFGRASFLSVSVDFVQPGLEIPFLFWSIPIFPETNLTLDIGLVKLDENGDLSTNRTSVFITQNTGDMVGFDIGWAIEVGNGNAQNFFGKGFQFNIGYGGNLTGRFPVNINSNNPGGDFFSDLANQVFSFEAGPGGGFHYGEVETKPLISF